MSKYVSRWRFECEFDSDRIAMTLLPLKREQAVRLHALDSEAPDYVQQQQAFFSDLFAANVAELDGLRDAAGDPVPVATVAHDAYFTALITAVARELLHKAMPREG